MNVQDVMNREVWSVEPRTLLVEAARRMVEHDIGFLPVLDAGTLVGVVTDRDIVARGVAAACNLSQAVVADVMSMEIVCCYPNQSTDEVKRLMVEHNVSRLPVIDDGHGLIGIVSSSNIDGRPAPRKKSVHVTFHKEKTDAYGRPHKVPVKTIYITGKPSKEEAVEAAVQRFEAEQRTSWKEAASGIDVADGPEEKTDKPS
jgi:CBS domain-containing protein